MNSVVTEGRISLFSNNLAHNNQIQLRQRIDHVRMALSSSDIANALETGSHSYELPVSAVKRTTRRRVESIRVRKTRPCRLSGKRRYRIAILHNVQPDSTYLGDNERRIDTTVCDPTRDFRRREGQTSCGARIRLRPAIHRSPVDCVTDRRIWTVSVLRRGDHSECHPKIGLRITVAVRFSTSPFSRRQKVRVRESNRIETCSLRCARLEGLDSLGTDSRLLTLVRRQKGPGARIEPASQPPQG